MRLYLDRQSFSLILYFRIYIYTTFSNIWIYEKVSMFWWIFILRRNQTTITKDDSVKKCAETRFILRGRWNSSNIKGIPLMNQKRNLESRKNIRIKNLRKKNSTQKMQVENETQWIQRKIIIFKLAFYSGFFRETKDKACRSIYYLMKVTQVIKIYRSLFQIEKYVALNRS